MSPSAFVWGTLSADIDTLVSSCTHCLSTIRWGKVSRPFGTAVRGTKANDLLQLDYIEIAAADSGEKYVLSLRDDRSNYCWFFAFSDRSVENAAQAIIDWFPAFGVPSSLMSDGPAHLKNETFRLIVKGSRVPHHSTLPYTPWSNGGVERLGKNSSASFVLLRRNSVYVMENGRTSFRSFRALLIFLRVCNMPAFHQSKP